MIQPARTLIAKRFVGRAYIQLQNIEHAILLITLLASVLIGSFLLFQIQPVMGKIVTPKFGGTSSVWTFCLLFFQLVLLAGYLFTYFLSKFPPKLQVIIYGSLFLLSMVLCRVPDPGNWSQGNPDQPIFSLFVIAFQYLFAPCLLISSVSGMMQIWYCLTKEENPYWLYAFSNTGSLVALLTYPLLIEPNISLGTTIRLWNMGYLILGALILIAALQVNKLKARQNNTQTSPITDPGTSKLTYWCILAAMTSANLICYTEHLTQDIAPIPLLWIAPLLLFMLSYILCFAHERLCISRLYLPVACILWIIEPFLSYSIELSTLCILSYILFFSLGLNSELVRSKPSKNHLALFYLATAIGGTLGGVLENILLPAITTFYAEKILLFAALVLILLKVLTADWISFNKDNGIKLKSKPNPIVFGITSFFLISITLVGSLISDRMINPAPEVYVRMRNFYGCVSVEKTDNATSLVHGRVIHGTQLNEEGKHMIPTRYFAEDGGFGYAMRIIKQRQNALNCAVLGLGAGTIACYSDRQDKFVYYEIDPDIVYIAQNHFTFLSKSKAKNSIVLGDGRLKLNESQSKFNLIVLDAFNGNAVPVHLLTIEAFQTYLDHLESSGFLLINISNRHINLEPLIGNIASKFNLYSATFANQTSTWILVSKEKFDQTKFKNEDLYKGLSVSKTLEKDSIKLWTDSYSNLLEVLIKPKNKSPIKSESQISQAQLSGI